MIKHLEQGAYPFFFLLGPLRVQVWNYIKFSEENITWAPY